MGLVVRLFLFIAAVLFYTTSSAQCLKAFVSLKSGTQRVEKLLESLDSQVKCSFTFNATQISLDKLVTTEQEELTLENAIKKVIPESVNLIVKGRHLMIIPQQKSETVNTNKSQGYIIEGVVTDKASGSVISKATVFCIDNKYTAVTNEQGQYSIKLNTPIEQVGISVSKQSYFDTLIIVRPSSTNEKQNVQIQPKEHLKKMPTKEAKVAPIKEVEALPMVRILVPEKQSLLARNLEWLENIPAQASVLPRIGTSSMTSGLSNVVFSLNLFSGYNANVTGIELGGLNIVRKDVKGIQSSYIGNIVGGKVRGLQSSAIFNNVRGSVIGVQAAGLYNVVLDTVKGLQIGGVFNILQGSITGAQLGGIFNVATENMAGLQIGGITNITRQDVTVGQFAGIHNYARNVSGVQVAGISNVATGRVKGVQVAGISNVAGEVTGTQISGIANKAQDAHTQIGFINSGRNISGSQVGFINVSDSSKLSVGFLSFARKGFHCVDFTAEELHPFNITVRTGVQKFYNIFYFGYGSYLGEELWSYGYGGGVVFPTKKERVTWNLDLLVRQVENSTMRNEALNLDIRIQPQMVVRIGKKRPSLVFGGSIHALISTEAPYTGSDLISNSYPPIYQSVEGVVGLKPWLGANAGIRF